MMVKCYKCRDYIELGGTVIKKLSPVLLVCPYCRTKNEVEVKLVRPEYRRIEVIERP